MLCNSMAHPVSLLSLFNAHEKGRGDIIQILKITLWCLTDYGSSTTWLTNRNSFLPKTKNLARGDYPTGQMIESIKTVLLAFLSFDDYLKNAWPLVG